MTECGANRASYWMDTGEEAAERGAFNFAPSCADLKNEDICTSTFSHVCMAYTWTFLLYCTLIYFTSTFTFTFTCARCRYFWYPRVGHLWVGDVPPGLLKYNMKIRNIDFYLFHSYLILVRHLNIQSQKEELVKRSSQFLIDLHIIHRISCLKIRATYQSPT
jgi:hypothetical protein